MNSLHIWIMFLSKVKTFYSLSLLCSALVQWSQFSFFLQSKTETMNGNSRRESETESSSSLESWDPLRRSSASDSLRRYTYLPTPSYAHTHKNKKNSTMFDIGYVSRIYIIVWCLINDKAGFYRSQTYHHHSLTFFN